jgi:5-methyltetrahydrofolate--homocysteine methyltransferase
MADLQSLADAIIKGKHKDAESLTREALETLPADVVLKEGLIAAMRVVGIRFARNEVFVPEVLISARAMKAALAVLEPILTACGIKPHGTVVLGTVKGDLHDIGKNLVGMMLKGNGFKVIDLGVNVSHEKYIQAIEEHRALLMGMSALLTTTMPYMATVIEKMKEKGIFERCKTMVGGAPVTQKFADQVGAHGYAKDAASAVLLAKALAGITEPAPASPSLEASAASERD